MKRAFCISKVLEGSRRVGKILLKFLLIGCLGLLLQARSYAYVMPSEQLIKFLAANFSKIETLVVEQLTWNENDRQEGRINVFRETVFMKSPNLFHSKVVDPNAEMREKSEMTFRQVVIANTVHSLRTLFSTSGIDLEKVAFTRVDGIIAYRIGDKAPESPKILIEKGRFLPLLLTYRSPLNDYGDLINVRFTDYRQFEQGWYPFEIIYSSSRVVKETYLVEALKVNVPIDPALFLSKERAPAAGEETEKGGGPTEEERLRRVIRTIEEKYGW